MLVSLCVWPCAPECYVREGRGAAPPLCPEARRSYSCSWCSSVVDSEAAGWILSVWGCCLCCLRRRWLTSRTVRASWRRSCRLPWRMTSDGSWWPQEAAAYRLGAQGCRTQWHGSTSPADWKLQRNKNKTHTLELQDKGDQNKPERLHNRTIKTKEISIWYSRDSTVAASMHLHAEIILYSLYKSNENVLNYSTFPQQMLTRCLHFCSDGVECKWDSHGKLDMGILGNGVRMWSTRKNRWEGRLVCLAKKRHGSVSKPSTIII